MKPAEEQTPPEGPAFDFSAYPADTLFLDRRTLPARPHPDAPVATRPTQAKPRKERRRRVDPTTFEKQYSETEIEFMNAVQDFKLRSGKMFPSHGDILRVALNLGYRKPLPDLDGEEPDLPEVAAAVGF